VAAQGAPPKRDIFQLVSRIAKGDTEKESDEGDSGTIDEELDAASRRAPPGDARGWTASRLASTLKTDPSLHL
jgi:hypothetical protein